MTISNADDIIDSRDVIARIDELESAQQSAPVHTACIHCGLDIEGSADSDEWRDRGNNTQCPRESVYDLADPAYTPRGETEHEAPEGSIGSLDDDEAAELCALRALASEAEGYAPDWQYGAALIRDSYFKEYAQQLAEDIGAINAEASWPNNCIDWDQAARELQMDYTSVDFDGVTYWIR